MALETELKCLVQPQDLQRLLNHPLLAAPPRTERLWNTYFDTPDLSLSAERIAIRERRVGDHILLTVKTAGHSVDGLSQRQEWEGPVPAGSLDFAAWVDDAALAARLKALAPVLRPVFRTDFVRRSWVLDRPGARVEVALDEGLITAGHRADAPEGTHSEGILELELELLEGPPQALKDLADALQRVGAPHDGENWLQPCDRSKAQRGLDLFRRATAGSA